MTNKETFSKIDTWMQYINEKADAKVVKFLVANKIDLLDDRAITPEEGKAVAKKFEMQYCETSAKSGSGVKEALDSIIEKVYFVRRSSEERESLTLSNKARPEKKKGCC